MNRRISKSGRVVLAAALAACINPVPSMALAEELSESTSSLISTLQENGSVTLEDVLAEARGELESVVITTAEASDELYPAQKWVTQSDADALSAAISAAQSSADPTSAAATLNAALNIFKSAKTKGGKDVDVDSTYSEPFKAGDHAEATLYSDGAFVFTGYGELYGSFNQNSVWYPSVSTNGGPAWYLSANTNIDSPHKHIKTVIFSENLRATDLSGYFYTANNLETVKNFPQGVEKMEGTFGGCTTLTTLPELPSTVKSLWGCFSGCKALTSAPVIPTSVTNVEIAFSGCSSLTAVPSLPSGITDLKETFENCTALISTGTIPDSVKTMYHTFEGCTGLQSITSLPSGVTSLEGTFFNCSGLTDCANVTIPSTVTNIIGLFSGCKELTKSPAIPNGVIDMQTAFNNCTALTEVPSIPSSVKNMTKAFSGCKKLAQVTAIPDGVTDLTETFKNCTALTMAPSIPSSVVTMKSAFYGCTALTTAPAIANGVEDMSYAFRGCSMLETPPTLPSTVSNLDSTFYQCKALKNAPNIPVSATNVKSMFYQCISLQTAEHAVVPGGVGDNSEKMFALCSSLTKPPTLSEGVENLNLMFNGCTVLESAPTIPNSVTKLASAFQNCKKLTAAPKLPDNAFQLDGTFNGCDSLTTLPEGFRIPSSATSMNNTFKVSSSSTVQTLVANNEDYNALIASGYDWAAAGRELVPSSSFVASIETANGTTLCYDTLGAAISAAESDQVITLSKSVSTESNTVSKVITIKKLPGVNAGTITAGTGYSIDMKTSNMIKVVLDSSVQSVIDKIAALSDPVVFGDQGAIDAARNAYNALDDTRKALVSNIDKLAAAETSVNDLEAKINALQDSVDAADQMKADVAVSANGYDVCPEKTWVTSEVMQALEDAVSAAKALLADDAKPLATTAAISDAAAALAAAVDGFKPANGSRVDWNPPVTPTPTPEPEPEPTPDPEPVPEPEPEPTPDPVVPGTSTEGTDASGNTVDVVVSDNNAGTTADGTEYVGSVVFEGTDASGKVVIPETVEVNGSVYLVTEISASAFEGNEQLTSVVIPETVTVVGNRAFANSAVTSVTVSASVEYGTGVFRDCDSLKKVTIEKGVTAIEAYTFKGCDSLKSVTIATTVKVVGTQAFAGCKSLKSVTVTSNVTKIASKAFSNSAVKTVTIKSKKLTKAGVKNALKGSSVTTVKVPASMVKAYTKLFSKSNCGKKVTVVKA